MIEWLTVIFLAMSPISELRGAIPAGVALGLNPFAVFCISVLFNILIFFPVFFVLKYFYHILGKIKFVHNVVEHVRKKEKQLNKDFVFLSLMLFVAVPLPMTGAWTGTILAWLLGLDWKKACTAISFGVLFAGVLILTGTMGGLAILGG